MFTIQANPSGSRTIHVSEAHLHTINQYALFRNFIDSTGIVDEDVLDKLKLTLRSMLESQVGQDKALLDLCLDVIYHPHMKAYGLQQLELLFNNWKRSNNEEQPQKVG